MNPRVLCVDDERNVLEALERTLFDCFEVDTATSGAAALELLERERYAVIVSDMRMPQMNGAQLLSQARKRSPDTVRILLTGHTDVEAAIAAVNDAGIFRYLVKPCPPEHLIATIAESAEQYRLKTAERELLTGTLAGVMKLLADVLHLAAPELSSRALRIEKAVRHLVRKLGMESTWQFEIAGLVSQLGCLALPAELASRVISGTKLNDEERALFEGHPETAYRLLAPIPRMKQVAEMIRLQLRDDLGGIEDSDVRLGAELLRVAVGLDAATTRSATRRDVMATLRRMPHLRSDLVELLADFELGGGPDTVRFLSLRELRVDMVLAANVTSNSNTVVLPAGRQLNLLLIERLKKFSEGAGIVEPIAVHVRRST